MEHAAMKVLVVDVGGTNIKASIGGKGDVIKIPSGPDMTATRMADEVKKAVAGQDYDVVSIGYPGPVVNGRPAVEPHNLGAGWMRFDYKKAFGKPVKVVNDAAMQALGSYQGGRMLYLGLGTGLGSAFVGDGALKRMGRKRWQRHVENVVELLKHGLQADYVMLGGGNTKKLTSVPRGVRLGTNAHAILGGLRLWNADESAPQVSASPRGGAEKPS